MRNILYAISLLLSFLAVLSHEMIAHHHHDELALSFSVSYVHDEDHEHKHSHEGEHQHNHGSKKEEKSKEHKHPFPFHQHVLTSNDIYIKIPNLLESNTQIRNISIFVYTELYRSEFLKPPNLEVDLYKEPPFVRPSICNLEAFALRGPPYIV